MSSAQPRFNPRRIVRQILTLQAAFYALLLVSTAVWTTVLGHQFSLSYIFSATPVNPESPVRFCAYAIHFTVALIMYVLLLGGSDLFRSFWNIDAFLFLIY